MTHLIQSPHRWLAIAFALAVASAAPPSLTMADSTVDPANKSSYGANTGWINWKPDQPAAPEGAVVGETVLSGFIYSANLGWINLGDGSPSDGVRYANNSGTDFGVNHDGAGNLSGFAYSANTGWVNFGWASSDDSNRPRIDLVNGGFSGFAYSANTGWINLGTGDLATGTIHCEDTDSDGIGDAWERENFGDLTTVTATSDNDGDGQTDLAEYLGGTTPNDPNSFLRILSQTYNGSLTNVTLEFSSSPGRVYRIERSDDLVGPWTGSGLGTFAADAGASTSKSFSFPGGDRTFFRAVAVKPLQ